MKKNTVELTGPSLDYAVAMAKSMKVFCKDYGENQKEIFAFLPVDGIAVEEIPANLIRFRPVSGSQGDDIIDEEGIATRRHSNGKWYAMMSSDLGDSQSPSWSETTYRGAVRFGPSAHQFHPRTQRATGSTRREAALRCFVLTKLGAQVDVPKELQ